MSEGQQYDAPNQQVVRPDGSAPWDEGSGGSKEAVAPTPEPKRRERAPKETAGEYPPKDEPSEGNEPS